MRLIIMAPAGKMGKAITRAAMEEERLTIVAGIGPKGRDYIGRDIGLAAAAGRTAGAPVSDDLEKLIGDCDAIIDFSTRALSMATLDAAVKHKKALVCGTTGFSPEEERRFAEAAFSIPVIHAANTSRVVNLMNGFLKTAAQVLGQEADIEIIEMHDRKKADAPSGTSREMAALMAEGLGKDWKDLAEFGRTVRRREDGIGFHSVRAGNIASSHTVMFGLLGERLEITHHAYDWECFARGACAAALFLEGKPAGLYTMRDVLALKD